jgi:2-hydroxychromene-2-carboxylate isomerase
MPRTLEFYYDFSCPYAFLGSTQVRALAERADAELVYRPFLLGGVFKEIGTSVEAHAPARMRVDGIDLMRWAEHWGVALETPPGHPNRTTAALRAALASDDLPRATHALFSAYWQQRQDLSKLESLRQVLDGAGFDGAKLVARAQQDDMKAELRRRTDEALSRGVFGAPTFFVDGEMYWGQDRLDFVARALGLDGWDEPGDAFSHEAPTSPGASSVPPPPSEPRVLEFWYDFASPFAYLGSTQVDQVAARASAEVVFRPFLLGGLFREIGTQDVPISRFPQPKQRYIGMEIERYAKSYGVPFRFPSRFPVRSILPLRVALAAGSRIGALSHAIFRAYWGDDRDISDPDELKKILAEAGLDPALVDRANEPEIKDSLKQAGQSALELGLCGVPSFVIDDRVYWGQDRLGFVAKALRGWRPTAG